MNAPDPAPRPAHETATTDLVLRRVRAYATRRRAWLASIAGASGEVPAERDDPADERAFFASPEAAPLTAAVAEADAARAGDAGARLRRLAELFGLSPAEADLVEAAAALAIDPSLGPLYGELQLAPRRTHTTEALAARLFGHGRQAIWHASSPLAVWQLVAPAEAAAGEPVPLVIDPVVRTWLEGSLTIDALLVGAVDEVTARPPLADWPVAELTAAVRTAVGRGDSVRLVIEGRPGAGRRTLAATIAAELGVRTLAIDTGAIADADWADAFVRAQRLAILGGTALVWHGARVDRSWPPGGALLAPLQAVAAAHGADVAPAAAVDVPVAVSPPAVDERLELVRRAVPGADAWPAGELAALAARHHLTCGDIAELARRAPATVAEASTACRELGRGRLGDLGQLLACPFTWDDLVVPDALGEGLADLAFEARERPRFWQSPAARRLYPRGTGLVALLSGPPGTGKTMAAQVVAADLDLDLYRIDLASAVSKYIGETAKNLRDVFSRAAHMNAVLLFDEADALFGRRTEIKDAHDRYANADTNYLLQLLEEYEGVALLATNRKNNIDPAFIRRVRYLLEFPRPDAAARRRIWHKIVGELCGADTERALAPQLDLVADRLELSGAQIKNAVLAAAFVARRAGADLGLDHLVRGIDRELGKEGRAVGRRELERLYRDA